MPITHIKPAPILSAVSETTMPSHIKIGMVVYVWVQSKERIVKGVARYIGKTTYQKGFWIGVELNESKGDNNGALKGHAYFHCRPNHGIFVRATQVSVNIPFELLDQSNGTTNGSSSSGLIKLKHISMLLKSKIMKSMDILNKQLEVAELLEKGLVDGGPSIEHLSSMLRDLCGVESDALNEFKVGIDTHK